MRDLATSTLKLVLLCTIGLQPLLAQSRADVDGQWVLTLHSRTLLVLTIRSSSAARLAVSGSLIGKHFQTADGHSFSHVGGGSVTKNITASNWRGDALALTLQNVANATDRDEVTFTLQDHNHAQLLLDKSLPSLGFVRAKSPAAVTTDWDTNKLYSSDDEVPSNPEMKRLYDADQAAREKSSKIDWFVVRK